jgi:formamidopyrimidine-DNA glycosylase
MPELPEVEVTVRHLRQELEGAVLLGVKSSGKRLRHPLPAAAFQELVGQPLISMGRRAKYLIFEFPAGRLVAHLGMSGVMSCAKAGEPMRLHDHLQCRFRRADQTECDMVFHDPRRFGSVQWIDKSAANDPESLGRILGASAHGLEPFDPIFNGEFLFQESRGRSTPIKPWLMSGSVVVGVGNIYACEALHASGIHPNRSAGSISKTRYTRLVCAIQDILSRAIEAGGSSIRDFLGADGEAGRYGQSHQVYGREGLACLDCARPIRRIIQQQRSSFYCGSCQR